MIIDPSLIDPEINAINNIAIRSDLPISIHFPGLYGTNSMENVNGQTAGIILLGSVASVNDKNDWQMPLQNFILEASEKLIPILGICYGHQLLAHMFGGKVESLWNGEIKRGIRMVDLVSNHLWNHNQSGYLAYSHMEGVVECPNDFDIIAVSDMVKIDGIAARNKPIWGFQPHIEATKYFLMKRKVTEQFSFDFGYSILYSFLQYCSNN
ncbi:MAG: type 1 glutamine amidotransferase [Fidelibacterota bacterium]